MIFALLVLGGLLAVAGFICVAALRRSDGPEGSGTDEVQEVSDMESARIAARKQEAMDDIRRRRLHAEELLRRLDRWRT